MSRSSLFNFRFEHEQVSLTTAAPASLLPCVRLIQQAIEQLQLKEVSVYVTRGKENRIATLSLLVSLLLLQGGHDTLAASCGLTIQITGVGGATGTPEINGSTRDPFINQAGWHTAATKRCFIQEEKKKKVFQGDDGNIKQSDDGPWCWSRAVGQLPS